MKIEHFDDGSIAEFYENGDLVELIKDYKNGFSFNHSGDWGSVILRSTKDKKRGYTSHTSHVTVQLAGVSTDENSFQKCIASIPVWMLKSKIKEK